MNDTMYQVMPPLTADEYAELKSDIQQRGVMVPVEYDEEGNILDGHHRIQICEELGITDFPKVIRTGMTEAEKRTHARKLNMARRQLNQEQRRELIKEQLRETPEISDRQIATMLGTSQKAVKNLLSTNLDENGYPNATRTGLSMQSLYAKAVDVNHLFIQSKQRNRSGQKENPAKF